ncbi:MAG: hypothetical protein GF308_12320 [Candidatus Heimdallarchaeota archaeon]|nr:hypothetical protein [Candidatus Heimdallarchaeota archaeon]
MADSVFQIVMFIIGQIILILDAIVITSGILRKFARIEKESEQERTKLFTMVDVLEKAGIFLGVLTLIVAGYLAVDGPSVDEWYNPITIVLLCIIGAMLSLRMLEDSPIPALIAILAGFLGAAIFAAVFGTGYSRWIYFGIFLVVDIIIFALVRTLTKQMAMIGKILNWLPIAVIVSFVCLGWAIFQLVTLAIYGINNLLL